MYKCPRRTLGWPDGSVLSVTAASGSCQRDIRVIFAELDRVFSDPLALSILGENGEQLARESAVRPDSRRLRLFIVARTRFAEESLGVAVERGVRQLVVLGAGLDTYAYRGRYRDQLRIFEVDHPATQAWKRERLGAARIPVPAGLSLVGVDFERDQLPVKLKSSGFNPDEPAFFTWLGVVPYLAREAIWSTLAFIAATRGGAQVVFDYGDPPETLTAETRAAYERFAERVAGLGEPWVSFFEPAELHGRLRAMGFLEIDDRSAAEVVAEYLSGAPTASSRGGAHVLRATTR